MKLHVVSHDAALVRALEKEFGESVSRLSENNLSAQPTDVVLVDSASVDQRGLGVINQLRMRQLRGILLLRAPALAWTLAARACGAAAVAVWPSDAERIRELLHPGAVMPATGSGAVLADEFVGASAVLRECFEAATAAALSDSPVLIAGESGVGKGLLARIIHQHSARGGDPLITVNCAALNESILATELFGRTAALGNPVIGQIARGNGTLWLDHLEDLPAGMARPLARALTDKQFKPLGALEPQPVTMRVLASAAGEIDPELAHCFTIRIVVPPLRKRPEDIAPLVTYFLAQTGQEEAAMELAADALAALQHYEWPGNVRQLKHVIERAVTFAEHGRISLQHLPPELFDRHEEIRGIDIKETSLAAAERRHIREVWRITGGHISDTADLLGIHRNTLRRKLEDYGLLNEP